MKTASRNLLLFLVIIFMISCQKTNQPDLLLKPIGQPKTGLTLSQVQRWYQDQGRETPGFSGQGLQGTSHPRSFDVDWNQAESRPTQQNNFWLVRLPGRPTFRNYKLGFRNVVFALDSSGKIQERIFEIIPDGLYLQQKQQIRQADFTGRILIYDQNYRLMGGKVMLSGKQVGQIRPKVTPAVAVDAQINSGQFCQWYDNNYIDAEGVVTIFSEQICTTYTWIDGDIGGDYIGGGGALVPSVSNLPGEDHNKITIKSYMDCFSSIPDDKALMSITVYVQEPWPGTSFNIGPNSVGHTAIGLTKTNGSSSVTQTVGFYPDASGFSKMRAPGKLVDNSNLDYDVSISYNVSAIDFNKIVNYLSNPPSTYDLLNFNCTGFVFAACAAGDVDLPYPYNTLVTPDPTTMVMCPAGLGQSIEKLKDQPNVNSKGGRIPGSKGPCN